MFHVDFVGKGMVMVICFGNALSPPLQHVRDLPEFAFLCHLIAVIGYVAYSGMVCCLVLRVLVQENLGLSLLVIWHLFILKGVLVLIRLILEMLDSS